MQKVAPATIPAFGIFAIDAALIRRDLAMREIRPVGLAQATKRLPSTQFTLRQ
jgi:hypothetical protein